MLHQRREKLIRRIVHGRLWALDLLTEGVLSPLFILLSTAKRFELGSPIFHCSDEKAKFFLKTISMVQIVRPIRIEKLETGLG